LFSRRRQARARQGKRHHHHPDEIQRRRWNAAARASGVGMDAESVIAGFVAATPGAVASANAALSAGLPNQVADAMLDGVSRSAAKLAAMSLG
jgi:serine/threonine-protein kinase HipA